MNMCLAWWGLPADWAPPTCFILASSLRVCSSFLRSFLFPTRMIGTLGQKCLTSGVHFSGIFSVSGVRMTHWTRQTQTEGLSKTTTAAEGKAHPDCQGCRWRSTWGWRRCLGRREASAGRSPPDPLCPTEPVPPTAGPHEQISTRAATISRL